MSIERLSAEDELMLWPDQVWPQDIAVVAELGGARFRIEAVKEAVAGRLHLVPRFRQLLHVPREGLGGPLWIDDPDFDLDEHIRVFPLAEPGDEAQLLAATEQLRRRRLDHSRPLWEMWFMPGLQGGRVGAFLRTHHSIADGMAGVATLAAFLDVDPDAVSTSPEPWTPAPAPTDAELADDWRSRRRSGVERTLSAVGHPVSTAHRLASAWPGMRELIAEDELPATSLDRLVGQDRSLAVMRSDVEAIKRVAHARSAKVNDVLLTVIAGGLRRLLAGRGEGPGEEELLRVYVPVSLRHGQYANARGNQIAQMVVPLPIGMPDPGVRLLRIAAETAMRKARSRPDLGKMPHRGLMGRVFLKLINRQRVNVTTADLPGPPVPLFLAGAPLLDMFPLLPLIGKVSLGVGALSYAGRFNVMTVADRDGYPDLDVFVEGMRTELAALTGSAAGEARPAAAVSA